MGEVSGGTRGGRGEVAGGGGGGDSMGEVGICWWREGELEGGKGEVADGDSRRGEGGGCRGDSGGGGGGGGLKDKHRNSELSVSSF